MSDPFVAEIRIFAGNFAPANWAFCNGQLMPIQQNTGLFSLIGTTYGGNGSSTMALPDLQGRAPMHPGHGAGLTDRLLGESGGVTAVPLSPTDIPIHNHSARALSDPGDLFAPTGRSLARSRSGSVYQSSPANLVNLSDQAVSSAGGGQPHNNMQPFLTLTFIICLAGVYPPRS